MADTNNTINKFFLNAVQSDFSRDIFFRVADIRFDGGFRINENDLIYAKAASIPARQIGNVEAKYAGLTFNLPGTVTFPGSEGYEIDFYCDQYSRLRNIFLAESRRIFDHENGIAGSGSGVLNGTPANGGSYILLQHLDKNLNTVLSYRLIGASIRNVGAMDFQMAEGTGAIMSFKVTIAYHFFNIEQPIQGPRLPINL